MALTHIWRHRKENLKKCSLSGLEGRDDFRFYTYPKDKLPPFDAVVLATDAPVLTAEDACYDLLIIDGSWRYADKMRRQLGEVRARSLPMSLKTAYPRRQEEAHGLASIEAIYAAYKILGRNTDGLLDSYYWKSEFLQQNNDTGIF